MKTIRKYDGGGLALAAAMPEAIPLIIPAALAWAMKYTYEHPESTGMHIGMREAAERLQAAYAQMEAEEIAQVKAAAKARNNQIAEHYAKELANGPIVKNYANGTTTTITGYDPNTGRLTTTIDNPSKGWTFEGTAPELQYNYLNGVNLADELSGVVNTKYGTFTPEIDYVDWNTLMVKPGTLIEPLPKITTSRPIGLNPPIKINPRAMVLSTGQTVALPSDITDYRVFDEAAGDDEDDVVIIGSGSVSGEGSVSEAGSGGGSPRRNDDDDDDDNQISTVEEYIRRFGKNIDWRTARRIRKSERISHDANGNVNHRATRLLNRGVNAGTESAKTGGFKWKDFGWGISTGAGLTLGAQAIFGNKEEAKDPELHGDVTYGERAGNAIDQVLEDDTTVSTKTDSLTDWDNYFLPQK